MNHPYSSSDPPATSRPTHTCRCPRSQARSPRHSDRTSTPWLLQLSRGLWPSRALAGACCDEEKACLPSASACLQRLLNGVWRGAPAAACCWRAARLRPAGERARCGSAPRPSAGIQQSFRRARPPARRPPRPARRWTRPAASDARFPPFRPVPRPPRLLLPRPPLHTRDSRAALPAHAASRPRALAGGRAGRAKTSSSAACTSSRTCRR